MKTLKDFTNELNNLNGQFVEVNNVSFYNGNMKTRLQLFGKFEIDWEADLPYFIRFNETYHGPSTMEFNIGDVVSVEKQPSGLWLILIK